MQAVSAGYQIFCIQTKHERVDRSVFEPVVYGALSERNEIEKRCLEQVKNNCKSLITAIVCVKYI